MQYTIKYVLFLSLGFCLMSVTSGKALWLQAAEEPFVKDASAHWVSNNRVIWEAPAGADRYELRYSQEAEINLADGKIKGGTIIPLTPVTSLSDSLADRFRHIADWPLFSLEADKQLVAEAIKGQIVAIAYDASGLPLELSEVQFPGVIDQYFTYQGDLGPIHSKESIDVNVWSPTAQKITLKLYDEDKNPVKTVQPTNRSQENGLWNFEIVPTFDRYYYRFAVTVYHHQNGKINTYEVTDPYSVSLSVDSKFSQLVNLSDDARLQPEGWQQIKKKQPKPIDITVLEAHIRDFSMDDTTVPEHDRGTYNAFQFNGENGRELSGGMEYLKGLRSAGLTHIHFLPVNDIASITEDKTKRVDWDDPFRRLCEFTAPGILHKECETYGNTPIRQVFENLAANDPVTKEIQMVLNVEGGGLAPNDGFNWGYDPYHFNVPEGSYASDPDGPARILEFRNMVKALHQVGFKVVTDVVYNHTPASGLAEKSVLDKVVPGYYQRRNTVTGAVETSTCCQNTAAEHYMMEKLMIDSILLWAKEYKVDSFRFDLMGHHPRSTMLHIKEALSELTLEKHGVDGSNIYIYGEGWDFGEVAGDRIFKQATQFDLGGTGIGTFNDRIRDAIRGGNFEGSGRQQGFPNGLYLFPNSTAQADQETLDKLLDYSDRIRVGMAGNLASYEYQNQTGEAVKGSEEMIGYTAQPHETVNYIDKHDNETLWDNTQTKLPAGFSMDERIRVHMLSNAFVNYGQGVPFYQLGSDILRSKSLDRNSYNSGDWYNAVDFTLETNNWAIGLPPGRDNSINWQAHHKFLSNPNIKIEKKHKERAQNLFREQLNIRYSSPLFRLETAEQVHKRLTYHNTGPDQTPGIIAMSISDGACTGQDLDPDLDGIIVVFNGANKTQTIGLDMKMKGFELHPLQKQGLDEMVKKVVVQNGEIRIPALTAAVLIKPQGSEQGEFICNPWLGSVKEPGATIYFKKPGSWGKKIYLTARDQQEKMKQSGSPMPALGQGWYSKQLPDGVYKATVTFRDDKGHAIRKYCGRR